MTLTQSQFDMGAFLRSNRNALQFSGFEFGRRIIGQRNIPKILERLARRSGRSSFWREMDPDLNSFSCGMSQEGESYTVDEISVYIEVSNLRIKNWWAKTWIRHIWAGLCNRRIISWFGMRLSGWFLHPCTVGPCEFSSFDGKSRSSSEIFSFYAIARIFGAKALHLEVHRRYTGQG